MINWQPHKTWLTLLAAALVVMIASGPLLAAARQNETARLTQLRADRIAAQKALAQLRDDIAETERLHGQIDAEETRKALAPVDRLRAAKLLERRAGAARLSNLTYAFSPEETVSLATVGAGTQNFAQSVLSLSADAPSDLAAYQFIEALRRALPGRLDLREIRLERLAPDAPLSAANIRLSLQAAWLSNGAAPPLAKERP